MGFFDHIGSQDSGARYFARDGAVYARKLDGSVVEAGTALTANGRELDRHNSALEAARAQRQTSNDMKESAPTEP